MYYWASLRRSSPSISRLPGIQRLIVRPFFNQAPASSSSSLFGSSCSDEDNGRDSVFGLFLKLVSGIVVGSSLGFWYCSSSSSTNPFFSFADSPTATTAATKDDHDSLPAKKQIFLIGDAYRRKIFFNYEKRIRLRSPPEKVFKYFASVRNPGGEVLMTPEDLMRAVVPVFPPSESNLVREGHLRGEQDPGELHCAPSKLFMLFDINNDGLISFSEYIFFVTLLSIPESSFSMAFKMFDLDNNGEIVKEEFKKMMAFMQAHNRQGAQHRVGDSVENGGLLEYFFGKDGVSCLKHGKFVQFLRELHNEILRLEFAHYDYKLRRTISAKDFALSMVASADMSHINKFIDRVNELNNEPCLRDIRITWEEFKDFAELRKKLRPLSLAIFSYGKVNGLLTRKDFHRAASQVCGISLTENVVNIIFHVFDTNRDGSLSSVEFVRVLQRRERDTAQLTTEAGVMGLLRDGISFSSELQLKDVGGDVFSSGGDLQSFQIIFQ
ncbi:hypothetical protein HHK36_006310 [Tetracentron sinense]|uniref:EF-hand domain-containing protein n=1 Tax=Tetracentron sinense TaxID=13715 RepID=A0A834ZH85_TETSI|nr:hypothetical protein HHK36_006310 [Tetracentron sinense]